MISIHLSSHTAEPGSGHESMRNFDNGKMNGKGVDINFHLTRIENDQDKSFIIDEKWLWPDTYIEHASEQRTNAENRRWAARHNDKNPSYVELCKIEYAEMMGGLDWAKSKLCNTNTHPPILGEYPETEDIAKRKAEEKSGILNTLKTAFYNSMDLLAKLICICLIIAYFGHIFTSAGRKAIYSTLWKVYKFITVCLGYWNNETVEMYNLHKVVKEHTLAFENVFFKARVNELDSSEYAGEDLFDEHLSNIEVHERMKKDIAQYFDSPIPIKGEYASTLYAVIAPRATLLQLIPYGSILTIFTANMASSPFLVYSDQLITCLPKWGTIDDPFGYERNMQQLDIDEHYEMLHQDLTIDCGDIPNPEERINHSTGKMEHVSDVERDQIERHNEISREKMTILMTQKKELVREWVVAIDGIQRILASRMVNASLNFFRFLLQVGLVFLPQDMQPTLFLLAIAIMFPISLLEGLGMVKKLGGSILKITDDELRTELYRVRCLFCCFFCCTSCARGNHHNDKDEDKDESYLTEMVDMEEEKGDSDVDTESDADADAESSNTNKFQSPAMARYNSNPMHRSDTGTDKRETASKQTASKLKSSINPILSMTGAHGAQSMTGHPAPSNRLEPAPLPPRAAGVGGIDARREQENIRLSQQEELRLSNSNSQSRRGSFSTRNNNGSSAGANVGTAAPRSPARSVPVNKGRSSVNFGHKNTFAQAEAEDGEKKVEPVDSGSSGVGGIGVGICIGIESDDLYKSTNAPIPASSRRPSGNFGQRGRHSVTEYTLTQAENGKKKEEPVGGGGGSGGGGIDKSTNAPIPAPAPASSRRPSLGPPRNVPAFTPPPPPTTTTTAAAAPVAPPSKPKQNKFAAYGSGSKNNLQNDLDKTFSL